MKRYSKLLLFLFLITSTIHAQNTSAISAWKSVHACNFIFTIPSDLQDIKVWGIDSCVKHYRSGKMFIELDVTLGSTPNDEQNFRREDSNRGDFHLIETKVNGERALITTFYAEEIPEEAAGFQYAASLFVPYIGKCRQGLWMRTYSKTAEGQATAQKIFESIRYSIKRRRA